MPANSRCYICLLSILLLVPGTPSAADDPKNGSGRSDYELMALFVEVFEQVEANYVREVDRDELMEAAIEGMLSHLDQYSDFIPPRDVSRFTRIFEQEFGGIGIQVNIRNKQLTVVSPLPGSPAYKAGIRSGDVIVEVEGQSTKKLRLSGAVKRLQGPVGRPVTISVLHPGADEPEELTLVRELIKAPTVRGDHYTDTAEWEFMLPGEPRIGYIRVSQFSRHTVAEVRATVEALVRKDVQGLIVDLRFNPGGLLEAAIEMSDMFLESGTIVSVRGRNVAERSWEAKKRGTFPNFPMAVLVNGYSASASEVFSACLQDNKRAVVVGQRTWGKGSVQNVIRMEQGDSALKLTTASYHRPSGINIHRFEDMTPTDQWGVSPDEGFDIPYSAAQWVAWDRQRADRDALRREAESEQVPDAGTAETLFEDRQLVAAIDYIRNGLSGKNDAQKPVPESPDAENAPQETPKTPTKSEQPASDKPDGKESNSDKPE